MLICSCIFLIFHFSLLVAYPSYNFNTTNILNLSYLTHKINFERRIDHYIIVNAYDITESCLSDEEIKLLSINATVRLLQPFSDCQLTKGHINKEMLLIRCVPEIFKPDLFDRMIGCLGRRRYTRMLFIWNTGYTTTTMQKRLTLQKQQRLIFEYCAEMRLLNVIGIYKDYLRNGYFYTYSYFPHFQLERKSLSEDCFPDRIRDLKGAAIRSLPDQLFPWSIVWRNQYGRLQFGGLLTKLLHEFATRNNGTLTFPVTVEPSRYVGKKDWIPLFQNNTIDIVCGFMALFGEIPDIDESVTVLPVDWLIKLPMPARIPESEVFLYIINSVLGLFLLLLLFVFSSVLTLESLLLRHHTPRDCASLFITIIINTVLRGVIGQPSSLRIQYSVRLIKRLLYIVLFVCGIYMSTLISASLQSYLTNSFYYPKVNSLTELYNAGMKVKISENEYHILSIYIEPETLKWLNNVFTVVSFDEVQSARINLNNRFATTILSPLWSVMMKHQSFLPQPAFYASQNIYLSKGVPMAIGMQKYSIYRESLNKIINRAHSVGLISRWYNQAYDDMVAAKKLNTTINVVNRKYGKLDLEDFYWMWWLYGVGVIISILVFLGEIWYHKKTMAKAKNEQSEQNEPNKLNGLIYIQEC